MITLPLCRPGIFLHGEQLHLSVFSSTQAACCRKPLSFPYLHKWWCSHPNYQGNPPLPPSSTSPLAAALSLLWVLLADGIGASSAHWLFLEEEESDSPAGGQTTAAWLICQSVASQRPVPRLCSHSQLCWGKKGAEYAPGALLPSQGSSMPHTHCWAVEAALKSLFLYYNLRFRES